jgi:hypothetical protein
MTTAMADLDLSCSIPYLQLSPAATSILNSPLFEKNSAHFMPSSDVHVAPL